MPLRWLNRGSNSGWTAVDCGAEGVCGVTVLPPRSTGSKPRVVKCGFIPGAQLNAETLATLTKKISSNGCPWNLVLGRKEYLILVVPEPPVMPAEMEQSVRWSISTMIDFPIEEASVAWMKIPTAQQLPNKPSNLYVMVARSEAVSRYATLFKQAGLPLQAVDVRETAQRNIAVLAGKPKEGVGLLLVGRAGVQFTVSYDGELYLDRFVEESLFDQAVPDREAEKRALERIALQVQRSLDHVSRTLSFINVQRVLVAPTPSDIGLQDYVARNLPGAVASLDLAALFDFSLTPELMRPENQALYFSALGSALRFLKKTT